MDLVSDFPIVTGLDDIDVEKLPPILRAMLETVEFDDEDIAAAFQSSL